jgi:hypothetical protein
VEEIGMKVGEVKNGYIYKGGDDTDPASYEPVQGERKAASFGDRFKRGLLDVGEGINYGALQAMEAGQKLIGKEPSGVAAQYKDQVERRMAEYEGPQSNVDLGRTLGRAAPWMLVPAGSGGKGVQAMGTLIGKNAVGRAVTNAGQVIAKSPVLDSAFMGAVQGGAMMPEPGQSRATNALLGGAGGALGGVVAQTAGKALGPKADAHRLARAQAAREKGFTVTPAMSTKGRIASNIEGALDALPFTSGNMQRIYEGNQQQANKIASSVMGELGENHITDDVMNAAKERLGAEFRRLSAGQKVNIDAQFFADIATAKQAQNRVVLKALKDTQAEKIIDEILALPQGQKMYVPGEKYQATRSALTKAVDDAFRSNNSKLGGVLENVRDALDEAAYRSAPNKEAWGQVRQQWGAFKALSKPGVIEDGNVNIKRLATVLRSKNPQAWATGTRDELTDLAKLAPVLKTNLPNSGTAERSLFLNLLTGGVGGAAGYAIGGPGGGATGTLLGMTALPKVAEMAYMNPATLKAFESGLIPQALQPASKLLGPWGTGAARAVGAPYAIDLMQ